MTEAEQVLAELARAVHHLDGSLSWDAVRAILAPYIPKPEPDRLTVAARECYAAPYVGIHASPILEGRLDHHGTFTKIRAIIAREVAAAEPSDEALDRVIGLLIVGRGINHKTVRAALKGEGA